jgi:glucosamine--fructose-6-phosphate aminotransferase (isomerizing)
MRDALDEDEVAARLAGADSELSHCVVLGRGYHYATAREWALKLKELALVLADPYSFADFEHGPVGLIDRGFRVLAVTPSGAAHAHMLKGIGRLRNRLGASMVPCQLYAYHLSVAKKLDPDHPRSLRKVTLTS